LNGFTTTVNPCMWNLSKNMLLVLILFAHKPIREALLYANSGWRRLIVITWSVLMFLRDERVVYRTGIMQHWKVIITSLKPQHISCINPIIFNFYLIIRCRRTLELFSKKKPAIKQAKVTQWELQIDTSCLILRIKYLCVFRTIYDINRSQVRMIVWMSQKRLEYLKMFWWLEIQQI
jgi:hypothetical protein